MQKSETGIINVLAIGIICCTVVLSLLAVFFNIYSYDVSKEERIILTEKIVNVDFKEGNIISWKNAQPGTQIRKTIVISAAENSTSIIKYRINLDILENNIASDYLVYEVIGSSNLKAGEEGVVANVEETPFPKDGQVETLEGSLKPGEVHTYTYGVYYTRISTVKKNVFNSNLVVEMVSTTSNPDDFGGQNPSGDNSGTSSAPVG